MFHAAIASLITVVVGLQLAAFAGPAGMWVGAASAIGFYYGREVRDDENRRGGASSLTSFAPWMWTRDGMMDLAFAVGPALAIAILAGATN